MNGELYFAIEFFFASFRAVRIEPNLRDVPTQTGQIVMDVCRIGVGFPGSICFFVYADG